MHEPTADQTSSLQSTSVPGGAAESLAASPIGDVPLSVVTRGEVAESWHRGCAVVVECLPDGQVVEVARWGDAELPVYARSAIKPFQALPLFERGLVDALELTDQELAVISASHNGTPEHVEVVQRLLARGGFTVDDLRCGPHAPFEKRASLAIAKAGEKPTRLHNNCSGKHAGFLLLAHELGVDRERYLDPGSRSQRLVRAAVASMVGDGGLSPESVLRVAIDGCGAPTLQVPLAGLARGFARLLNPVGLGDVRAAACRRLLGAVSDHPVLLAGYGRLCTALIRSAPGRIYPKNGAEGIYNCGFRALDGRVLGLAVKVSDGAERGYFPVVIELLRRFGLWERVPASLQEFATPPIRNTQKLVVGDVRCALRAEP